MATAICSESKSRLQFEQALSIAESELLLTKVRSIRFRVTSGMRPITGAKSLG
jgi:hypothetical protein